ncbi:S-adenosyl-L-methionine-dependent methyltransferase [Lasiosphaeria ovina]|uniref:S-adenosyl-L-methionine-dependent methyltransferase n=1 Tax=Lasiosphaeria ovina TaxID=92902 RepID=A0AAE0KMB8_9PEZI|nr:S-adenosyl-L-methionine-dependent methyltransferase [Lasiosphaeria ovina]
MAATTSSNDRFNTDAATWDENLTVQRATGLAHKAYLAHLEADTDAAPLATSDVLEIGCGTGLLSLALAPAVASLVAVDPAEGMIAALNAKLESQPSTTNVRTVCATLHDADDPQLQAAVAAGTGVNNGGEKGKRRFDLVVSHLVLHHVPDLDELLAVMFACLRPGGRVLLTDFEDFGPAARSFHPEAKMDGVARHGLKRTDMAALLARVGFEDLRVETAFSVDKHVETQLGSGDVGPLVKFPFLLCSGRKP